MTSPRVNSWSLISFICLVLGGVVFSLILGEGLLRLFSNRLPNEIRQIVTTSLDRSRVFHPYIGHLHTPNADLLLVRQDFETAYQTDDYGFRNPTPWPQRASIVAVGDSLTFGYGVEDDQAWPRLINRAWPEVRVMNLGLIGAAPQQYLRVYETFGRKLQPRLLLVGLFARNDFWDADMFDRWVRSGSRCNYLLWRNYGRGGDCEDNWQWNAKLLAHRSYLYKLSLLALSTLRELLDSKTETFQLEDGRRLKLANGDFEDKASQTQPDRREFQLVLRTLQTMHAAARQDGTRTLIVFLPSKEEVYLPLLREGVADPSRPLREELKKSGIDYLDLTPVFRERAAGGKKLFFETDGHPNAEGQALIADAVLAYVKQDATEYGLTTPGQAGKFRRNVVAPSE